MTTQDDEKLNRLLRQSAQSLPALEPDPHLPVRIRAMTHKHKKPRLRVVGAPRHAWLRTSLAAAALVVAIAAGAYLGYSAGETVAAASTTQATAVEEAAPEVTALWSAWSQTGFAEDWQQINQTDGDAQP